MMEIDIKQIKELIKLLEKTSISEIDITEGNVSLRLSRQGSQVISNVPTTTYTLPMNDNTSHQAMSQETDSSIPTPQHHAGHIIRSPMVGTFYSSSSPDTPPYVSIGQKIEVGEVLCIVEAMKMFNEIESDRSGILVDMLVKNGEPIEYDQPLFVIE